MDDPTSDSLVDNRGGQSAEGSKPPNSVVWALDTQWDEASEARAHRAATASPPSNLGGIVGSRISPERISVSGKKPQRGRGERERCRGSVFARFFSSLLEGISGSRVDLTMDGLAAGFNCNTPTRAAFIFGGSFVLMLYISLLPSLEYWGYTGAGELPVGVSRPDAAILMKLAVQVLGAVCGASVFVMCCVPRWRPRAMRAQAPMGAVLFMCVVWNVVDNYFIIWWDRDFLTEWDAVVGTCITLSIPWAFLLNSNPRPMAKALQKWTLLAASVAVVVAQAYVEWKNSTGSAGAPRTAGMFFLFLALCLTLSFLMDCRDLVAESAQRAARERAFSARRSIKDQGKVKHWVTHFVDSFREKVDKFRNKMQEDLVYLRVIYLLWWLMVLAMAFYALVLASTIIWEDNSADAALGPIMALLVSFLSFSLGTALARVLIKNREEVLSSIVPVDVAQTLVQTHNNRRKAQPKQQGVRGTRKSMVGPAPSSAAKELEAGVVLSSSGHGGASRGESFGIHDGSRMSLRAPSVLRPREMKRSRMSVTALDSRQTPDERTLEGGHDVWGVEIRPPWMAQSLMPWGHSSDDVMHLTENLTYFKEFEDISMVFSDICGFTGISERVPPNRMLMALHNVFLALDHVVGALKAYKYETVGDAYISLMNGVHRDRDHPITALTMGVTLIRLVSSTYISTGFEKVNLGARVGIQNTASRMESHGVRNHVQVTENFWRRLPTGIQALFEARDVAVKGKGMMKCYLLDVLGKAPILGDLGLDLMATRDSWAEVMATPV